MISEDTHIIKKKGINYLIENDRKQKFNPWLGDLFAPLYDRIMECSVFPRKLKASQKINQEFFRSQLNDTRNKNVLELAAGSGNLSEIIPVENKYCGIDISKGLLKIAVKKFFRAGFRNYDLYLCSAEKLPFKEKSFDIIICNISLNFFSGLVDVVKDVNIILKKKGFFICSVPVPERNIGKKIIRGNLLSEIELEKLFTENGFLFEPCKLKNGALFYFKAVKE
jgi:ubiquinone/menaquinone biosynthesis C-methylase UbiE